METQASLSERVGRRLRTLREERQIRREQVALALEMGAENLRHYESGRTQLTVPMLPKLANAYGMSLTDLLEEIFELRATSNTGQPSTTKSDEDITANYNYTKDRKLAFGGVLTTEWDMGHGLVFRHIALARPLSQPIAHTG